MALEWDKAPADWFDHAENDDAINEHAFNQFLFWEAATHDTIDFKKVYVDIAGDLNAGLALSEIVYWYLPNKDKKSKLRVKKENKHWIACQRHEWWDRTRMSPKQIDRALDILLKHGLIEKKRFRFNGEVTVHVRLVHNTFMRQLNAMIVSPPENPFLPKGKTDFDQRVKSELPKGEIPLTETITETTTKDSVAPKGAARVAKPKTKADTVRSVPMSLDEQHPERSEAEREARRKKAIQDSIDQTNREIARQKNFAELEKAVKVLPGVAGKVALKYAHMINGTATTDTYAKHRIEGGLTAVEFNTFISWYRLAYPTQGLPKVVETLYGYLCEWIEAGKPTAPTPQSTDKTALSFNHVDRAAAEQDVADSWLKQRQAKAEGNGNGRSTQP